MNMRMQFILVMLLMTICGSAMAQAPGGRGRGGRGGPPGGRGPQGPAGGTERLLDDLPLTSMQQGIDARAALVAYDQTIRQQTLAARAALLDKMQSILSPEQFSQFRDSLQQVPLLPQVPPQQRGVRTTDLVQRMLELDSNRDGRVTKDELPERMASLMEQGDTNHDGALDREELTRMAQQNSVQPQPPGGGRGRRGGGPPGPPPPPQQ